MKIAAFYIPEGSMPNIFGYDHDEISINFGGRNLYYFINGQLSKVVKNHYYIDDIFDNGIALLSCIVGNNGGGKTTLLKEIANSYSCLYVFETADGVHEIRSDIEDIHRIYYTPYLHHKSFDAVRDNCKDLSKITLLRLDNHGDSGLLDDFLAAHNSENAKRWIKFNHFFRNCNFLEVSLPVFKEVKLSLRHFESNIYKPDKFHDTSYQLRPAISLLYKKIQDEQGEREINAGEGRELSIKEAEKLAFQIRFEYDVYEAALGKLVAILERAGNHYLNEGFIDEEFEQKYQELSARESIQWFMENSGVFSGEERYSFSNNTILLKLIDYVISLNSDETMTDNWREIIIGEEEALRVIELYDAFNNSFINEWFKYDIKPMFGFEPQIVVSSGEQGFLNLFSTLHYHAINIKEGVDIDYHSFDSLEGIGKDILLLLDEGDNAFHPQWKKEYVKYLRKILPLIFDGFNLQVIITSHDPLTLSDLAKNNVVFLDKSSGRTTLANSTTKRTLGANISDLMKESFFIQNGQIGSFIGETIDNVVNDIRNRTLDEERVYQIERIIYAIDEPVLKFKLAEMLSEATSDKSFETSLIDEEIRRLQERRRSL